MPQVPRRAPPSKRRKVLCSHSFGDVAGDFRAPPVGCAGAAPSTPRAPAGRRVLEGRAEPVGKRHRTRSDQLNLTNPTTDTLTNSNLPERCPQAKRPDAGGGLTPRPRAGEQDRRQLASAPVPVPPASARAQTAPMQAAPSNDVGNCMSMPAPPGASGARQRVASETGSKIPDLTRELLTIHYFMRTTY